MRTMILFRRYLSILFIATLGLLFACSKEAGVIPVSDKSQSIYHTAVPGDTLYSIAWRYDVDFVALAKANKLASPYLIRAGQRIYLNAKAANNDALVSTQNKINVVKQKQSSAPSPIAPSVINPSQLPSNFKWSWPSTGPIISRFAGLNKGIDISGKLGQPVTASATGTVVYAGSGLLGYGQLIIVKHNDQYLSAYAHNSELLVKENDRVLAGQKIAEMGATGTDRIKLHFEIRKEGKPVDPLRYLPAK